ncbi:MAG: DUF1156 domain-containing protein [Candidatus Omnitrophota bacterium]
MSIILGSHASPQLDASPLKKPHRLIDNGLFYYEASIAGHAERYRRGETSHTVHVWWARRPHASMRMLAFAALCKSTDDRALNILSNLGHNSIKDAQEILSSQYVETPKVLDMFAGGGTIPFEAANIGAESYSVDSNELSIFIQKCNLVYSQEIKPTQRIVLIKESGERVLNALTKKTGKLFPLRDQIDEDGATTFGYIWSYSIECPKCKYKYYLMKRPWLSQKHGKKLGMTLVNGKDSQKVEIKEVDELYEFTSNWIGRSGKMKCPSCEHITDKISIADTTDEILAIAQLKKTKGKEFVAVGKNIIPDPETLKIIEEETLEAINASLPLIPLPKWSGIVNPAGYGMETYADFLNARQRLVLVMLIESLIDEYEFLCKSKSSVEAKFVIGNLSSLIDQLVDWNCRLSMWISQNEQVGRAFCGPGVPMLWDYVETDPVMNGPANLWKKLDRIVEGVGSIPQFLTSVKVEKGRAQKLSFQNDFFDAIVTDPPYYDNVYYTALADFFYCWKRMLLKAIEPDLFKEQATDSNHELVASTFRNGDAVKAHESYCEQLTMALSEAGRVLKNDGIISFIYSHSSFKGWEALIRAFRSSNLFITSVQPLSIERKHRPRGMSSEAINTCIVFVGRKLTSEKVNGELIEIEEKIGGYCSGYAKALLNSGWQEQDVALAVFAQGVGLISNCASVDGEKNVSLVLGEVEKMVKKSFPSFKVINRDPL